jgi:hypothetical protein
MERSGSMKYMHFNSSCSYAALANLLERMGIETEDTKIALEMDLPWLFAKDGNTFVSGPMLQSAEWFNLWLKPRGLIMIETEVQKDALCGMLQSNGPLMLGIQTLYGKHAVVFTKYDGAYQFVNPTHENSGEKTELVLTEKELLNRTDETMMLASIGRTKPEPVDLCPYFRRSVQIIRENVAEIERFAAAMHDPDAYLSALNRLFRPLLLDGISMLTLIGETALAERFTALQAALLSFLRGPRAGRLKDVLSLEELYDAAEEYVRLIEVKIGKTIMQEASTSTLR